MATSPPSTTDTSTDTRNDTLRLVRSVERMYTLAPVGPSPIMRRSRYREFLDAVAVAMITPGPVVITVGFIGYLVAGFPGAVVAALATFLPCYLFTVIPAPHFKRIAGNTSIKAFVDGITAAVIGSLTGAVVIMALRSVYDWPTGLLAIASCLTLIYSKKLKEPYIILIAATAGFILKMIVH